MLFRLYRDVYINSDYIIGLYYDGYQTRIMMSDGMKFYTNKTPDDIIALIMKGETHDPD